MGSTAAPVGLVDFERDGVDLTVVEPKIRALVQALNGEACTTIASCEGHPSGGRTPYVLMHCAVPFAAALERRVSELHMKRGVLHYFWTLQGIFDPQSRLCFRLYSPELDRRTASLVQSVRLLGLDRSKVDSDLHVLADQVRSLAVELRSNKGGVDEGNQKINAQQDQDRDQQPVRDCEIPEHAPTPKRVLTATAWARIGAWIEWVTATRARLKNRHLEAPFH